MGYYQSICSKSEQTMSALSLETAKGNDDLYSNYFAQTLKNEVERLEGDENYFETYGNGLLGLEPLVSLLDAQTGTSSSSYKYKLERAPLALVDTNSMIITGKNRSFDDSIPKSFVPLRRSRAKQTSTTSKIYKKRAAPQSWTHCDDMLIKFYREEEKLSWKSISQKFNYKRTPSAVQMRYLRKHKPRPIKPLEPEQVNQVKQIIKEDWQQRFKRISKRMNLQYPDDVMRVELQRILDSGALDDDAEKGLYEKYLDAEALDKLAFNK